MKERTSEDLSILEVGALHWRLILVCTIGCAILAAVVTLILPKKYGAEVQFLVKNDLQDLTITPAQGSQPPTFSELTEAQVNSEMQMLLSHDLLQAVVMDDHLYDRFMKAGQKTPDAEQIQLAVLRLNKDLEITAVRKTNIIQAQYRAKNPQLAASVLADLSRKYLSAHLQAHSTPGSGGFFSGELNSYRTNLQKAETAASDFRRSAQIYDPEVQRKAMVGQLEDAETRLENADADIEAGNARLQALTREYESTPERIPTEQIASLNSLTVDHLQTELADMENRRIAMAAKFRSTDRGLLELEQEMANTRKNLAAAKAEYSAENTTAINPLHQTLAASLSDARVNLKTLEATRAALFKLKQDYLAALDEFDKNSVKLDDLNQSLILAQGDFVDYGKREASADLAEQMNKEKFSNVVMIETPVPSPVPVFPIMPLDVLLGMLIGLILGFTIAYSRTSSRELVSASA
jgi:succinoglycan biosynthesis transport protein ExoP